MRFTGILLLGFFTSQWFVSDVHSHSYNHAIYVSVLEIVHQPNKNTAEINIKVFKNDLEDVIHHYANKLVKLGKVTDCQVYSNVLTEYFNSTVHLNIGSSTLFLKLKHCEINDQSIWFIFSSQCPPDWTKIQLKANYFMELFPTQSNVVTVRHGDQRHMARLTKKNPQITMSFSD